MFPDRPTTSAGQPNGQPGQPTGQPRHNSDTDSQGGATSPTSPTGKSVNRVSFNMSADKDSSLPSPTGKQSTIMARAAFWDNRILEGNTSDKVLPEEAFPSLPQDTFKR